MQNRRRILLLDNDPEFLATTKEWLERDGYDVLMASSTGQAKNLLRSEPVQLIITDLRVTDDTDRYDQSGLIFAREFAPSIPKIILTKWPAVEVVRQALALNTKRGTSPAVDFVGKVEGLDSLSKAVQRAFDRYVAFNFAQFKIGGALTSEDDAVYISRQAEYEVIESLRRMDYLLIIEPRQQGKTSLINYLLRCSALPNSHLVYVDVATADRSSLESWYESVCARIMEQLECLFPDADWPNTPKSSVQWRFSSLHWHSSSRMSGDF